MGSLSSFPDKHINLQLGWPSPSLFPSKLLAEAAQETLLNPKMAAQTLVYGPDPGHELVRTGTAQWLNRFYKPEAGDVEPGRLFITPGASAALAMLLTRFTAPSFTQFIWMIEPTYFLACPAFQEAGFAGRLRGVPEDAEGLDVDFLRNGLTEAGPCEDRIPSDTAFSRSSKLYRHIIYMVPTFSNPSAKIMSLQRREQVVRLAREFDCLIISDDVYDCLRWPHPNSTEDARLPKPLPRLVDLDRLLPGGTDWGNAVSNGSFSKVVAPGVRVGWIEGSSLIARDLCKLGPVTSGGCQSQLSSMILGQMLISGKLEEHIQSTLIPVYQRRHRAVLDSIDQYLLPLGFKISTPEMSDGDDAPELLAGGFFLYLQFPAFSPPAGVVASIALDEFNLRIAHGGMMCVAGDSGCLERSKKGFGQGARLCWAWHDEADIAEGIQRLALAFECSRSRAT
ncbi:PLP-dependent transferase [Fusarium acutatum]|uniref:PLP-dependent transferase n=1 Tax=Fusarium acutatum TaxID=78861 RepID=A0A8H4JJ40_9HYPO|nr:PLP-dependent transferase [Fusarium acutatum]